MHTRSAGRTLVSLTALVTLALAPVPALADEAEAIDDDFASELSNPAKQEAMGKMMAAMLGAMLNMKTDPLARMAERMGDRKAARKFKPGSTLGDVAGPQAKRLPEEMRRQVPAMMGAMAEMAGMMKEMAPMMEAMGKELGDDFERQMDEAVPAA